MSEGHCEVCGEEFAKGEIPWLYMGHWFCSKHDSSHPWLLEFKRRTSPMTALMATAKTAPSELLLQIKNDFILTMPQSRAGKPISMKEAASLRVYKGLTELGEILRADSHSDAALADLKARIDGERKRANERIEAKRQQGYVYGALQYECNDDVVRLALLERLEAAASKVS